METSSNGTVLGNSVAKMEGMRVASPVDARKVEGLSMNGGVDGKSGAENPIPPPTNPLVTALLTDMYQITMAYAYWKAGKQNDLAVFDLLHRKNPFGGEYTVFAGLEECIRFAANFRFTDSDVAYLRTILPSRCEEAFFDYLKGVDCSEVVINAIPEGSVCFPRVPLIRVQGPLLIAQLLETTFLTLVNYASLVATNAARHRRVAGKNKILLEFGLRRAQGPDGGISGSKYCYLGGFNATSNIDAGQRFGIPVRGTHSHAFVSSFMSFDEITKRSLEYNNNSSDVCKDFVLLTMQYLNRMKEVQSLQKWFAETNHSELAAFISYALAFPTAFQALVDTYDVLKSGIPNFCAVALALHELGYKSVGIRLDSGDLSYFSVQTRKFFKVIEKEFGVEGFGNMIITASNDINEDTLDALNKQGHEIDAFGIGTHLITCYQQPALGCVYKLVEINGQPRIKLSEDVAKVTIPCKKQCYRLYGKGGYALVDLMVGDDEPVPKAGERILCRHPFSESKRAYVIPQRVESLYKCYWSGTSGQPREPLPPLEELRRHCQEELAAQRTDHMRGLNPTPYKVSVSGQLYDFIHFLWLSEAPVGELH
ncbi:nicotinate phosphoribosyltransferase [Marchantia polymorpha subsp. ruderalis]|uniref:Nicotinate phosphoribosyltransferase n=1 Tax=Marchantia polymorpha TaxID=3197 RepID=A0A2R6XI02_MARPO|nr:hypothetical protein MARPO_0013s0004 [Marchantia polymorpha]BBN19874.1 hypothetical protein Mp_8g14440 [Marchantia polymorpha subsp. ruderalis]|eukprot:PTQ45737.1 hypothetical protein MARPO_0013s0004 [Marchantia polymorpha]